MIIKLSLAESNFGPRFTKEPNDTNTVFENETLELLWQVDQYPCGWRVTVETERHSLHPNQSDIPIAKNREYNVTITPDIDEQCAVNSSARFEINVTVTLLLTENVLENVHNISCEVTYIMSDSIISSVSLILGESHSTTEFISDTEQPSSSFESSTTQLAVNITKSVGYSCMKLNSSLMLSLIVLLHISYFAAIIN